MNDEGKRWQDGKAKLKAALKAARLKAGWPEKKSPAVEAIVEAAGEAMLAGEALIAAWAGDAEEARIAESHAASEMEELAVAAVSLLTTLADFHRGMATEVELRDAERAAIQYVPEDAWAKNGTTQSDLLAPR